MTKGRFGIHGGQYVPETLMHALEELEAAYTHYKEDPAFQEELTTLLKEYANRPSPLYFAKRMSEDLKGAKIYLKREDLNHTGAHKNGEEKAHCRNRRWTTRRGHRHRGRSLWHGMCYIYGTGRYCAPSAQCL